MRLDTQTTFNCVNLPHENGIPCYLFAGDKNYEVIAVRYLVEVFRFEESRSGVSGAHYL
jgi:hypothetical protein